MDGKFVTQGIAKVVMTPEGVFRIFIKVTESKYTRFRFMERRTDTGWEYTLREFDYDKGVISEISEDDDWDLSNVYEAYEDTYMGALQHLREVLEAIAQQDQILAAKARTEEYEFRTSDSGTLEIREKKEQEQ